MSSALNMLRKRSLGISKWKCLAGIWRYQSDAYIEIQIYSHKHVDDRLDHRMMRLPRESM